MRASRLEDEDGESRTKGREREEEDESKGKRGMKNDKKSGRTGDQRRGKRGGREKDEGRDRMRRSNAIRIKHKCFETESVGKNVEIGVSHAR